MMIAADCWVPVGMAVPTELLPDLEYRNWPASERVLVRLDLNRPDDPIRYAFGYLSRGKWRVEGYSGDKHYPHQCVTHWMPLLEPRGVT